MVFKLHRKGKMSTHRCINPFFMEKPYSTIQSSGTVSNIYDRFI
jgi:hypothetical protein